MLIVQKQLNNTECHKGAHTDHLCYIISQGFHLSDEQGYKALVDKPEEVAVAEVREETARKFAITVDRLDNIRKINKIDY